MIRFIKQLFIIIIYIVHNKNCVLKYANNQHKKTEELKVNINFREMKKDVWIVCCYIEDLNTGRRSTKTVKVKAYSEEEAIKKGCKKLKSNCLLYCGLI